MHRGLIFGDDFVIEICGAYIRGGGGFRRSLLTEFYGIYIYISIYLYQYIYINISIPISIYISLSIYIYIYIYRKSTNKPPGAYLHQEIFTWGLNRRGWGLIQGWGLSGKIEN